MYLNYTIVHFKSAEKVAFAKSDGRESLILPQVRHYMLCSEGLSFTISILESEHLAL